MIRSSSVLVATLTLVVFLVQQQQQQHQANAFKLTDCAAPKAGDAKLVSLSINSCPDQSVERCGFVKGQNATMTLEFEPNQTFSQANIAIKAKISKIYIPFHLSGPSDACGNYGFQCPVKPGDKDRMEITIPVLRTYPSINVVVRFEMTDENKQPILCVEFPVALKK